MKKINKKLLITKKKEKYTGTRFVLNCFFFFGGKKYTYILYIYIYIYIYTVSQKSEYTPHISAINLVYLFKGQYYRNETWIYFRVVNVQLV